MQDRYAGDIGDYGKIGLLRAIQRTGLSIGINWYKTEPTKQEYHQDGRFRQEDGKYRIPPQLAECDPELAGILLDISAKESRSIKDIQKARLIPNAEYYDKEISIEQRGKWHGMALKKLANANVVFLDPDNGMLVKSVRKNAEQSVKYTFYEEVEDYVGRGQSVIVYNHRSRKKAETYFREICDRFREMEAIQDKAINAITFPRYTVRDYFIISANDKHGLKIQEALNQLLKSTWGEKRMCCLPALPAIQRLSNE